LAQVEVGQIQRHHAVGSGRSSKDADVQISNNSNGSAALQALQMLMASMRPGVAGSADATASTGQSLPGGSVSTSAPAPAPSAPASQFVSSALSFLTSLQDPNSAAASAAQSTASAVIDQGASDLSSVLDVLSQALHGSSGTASQAATDLSGLSSTVKTAANSLSVGTGSALVQALDQLGAAIGLKSGQPAAGGAVSVTA
jgi:hypothetical protein